jgi:hypothetical protein
MKNSLKYVSLWIPFVYSMAITGLALFGWGHSTVSLPPGFPALIAFLPMAFFFSALSTQSHLSRLERQIESVGKPGGPQTTQNPN